MGLLDQQVGTLFIAADSRPVGRMPTGGEMQKRFEEIQVVDGEVVSEAERAWLHGDAAAAETAGKEAL